MHGIAAARRLHPSGGNVVTRKARPHGHRLLRPFETKRCLFESRRPGELDRSPYSVVPESPNIGSRIPHQLSPGRPRRWRRLWRRPRRRGSPGSPAHRTTLACRALPVVAVIPVPVIGVAPAWVPLITWAPVIAGRRGRLGPGGGTASQPERGQSQPASHQHARRPSSPRSCLLCSRHLPRISPDRNPGK